ncbi:hypothetical protein KAS50_07455 [bacterium]|nr:hypothetical protein [bacterium]
MFSRFLTKENIRNLCDKRSFSRGKNYLHEKRVLDIKEFKGQITASVQGTHKYRVIFWIEDGLFEYACNCPYGSEGVFCKHCVAVGLELSNRKNLGTSIPAQNKKNGVTLDDVEQYLYKSDKDFLIKLLMEQALKDNHLSERLLLQTAKNLSKGIDLNVFRTAIENAIQIDDFVDYYSAYDYFNGIDEVINSLQDIFNEGFVNEVIELTEYAVECLEDNYGLADDSDGDVNILMERLGDLHLSACEKAKPDPVELAKRLFNYELNGEYDVFFGAAQRYAEILGKKGLAEYRKLAEKNWEEVSAVKHGQLQKFDHSRFRISHIMETLAKLDGDIEELVAIKSRDLSYAYTFLQIAEIYKKANMDTKALEWAEKGLKAFPKKTDSRLRDFLAKEYHSLGRFEEEMKLIWVDFTDFPCLGKYKKLKLHADRIKNWQLWREKAIDFVRKIIEKTKDKRSLGDWIQERDNSLLVEIFLWEKDIETSWQEAQNGGCSNDLWLKLADKRSKNHPEDSIQVYKRYVNHCIDLTNNESYNAALEYIRKINKLMIKIGGKQQFINYIENLQTLYKRKRNMMALINKQKWK